MRLEGALRNALVAGLAVFGVAIGLGRLLAACVALLVIVELARAESRRARRAGASTRRDGVLVVVAWPEAAGRVSALASLAPPERPMMLLAVKPSDVRAAPAEALERVELFQHDVRAAWSSALAEMARARGAAVPLFGVIGDDLAAVTLAIAAQLGATEILVPHDAAASFDAEEARALAAWSAVPSPKSTVAVNLVDGASSCVVRRTFLLRGDDARPTASA
ncbi:MAG TPA: hypothetical protein VGM56_18955 [Byssovorax sp.]